MKALLLAAGMGSRLRPITDHVPKCMVEIDGRPLLDYWIELLFADGIARFDEVLINTHYLPAPVRSYVEHSPWRRHITLIHEEELLGTGGTLVRALPRLVGSDVLVAHADNLTLFSLEAFIKAHYSRPPDCVATMMTFDTDSPQSCGIVETDSDGRIIAFHEKVAHPPGHRANAAVFIFAPEALDTIRDRSATRKITEISLDIVPSLMGHFASFHNAVYHRDIGSPQSLTTARVEFPAARAAFIASFGQRQTHHSPLAHP